MAAMLSEDVGGVAPSMSTDGTGLSDREYRMTFAGTGVTDFELGVPGRSDGGLETVMVVSLGSSKLEGELGVLFTLCSCW